MLQSILLVCLCPHFIFCVYVHGRGEAHGGRKPAANGGGAGRLLEETKRGRRNQDSRGGGK